MISTRAAMGKIAARATPAIGTTSDRYVQLWQAVHVPQNVYVRPALAVQI